MNFKDDIVNSFKEGSLLIKLIYINLGVFIVVNLLGVFFKLFQLPNDWINYLMLPACLSTFIKTPWTIVTYMFLHTNFIHILFNVLMLYWFGKLFMLFFSQKDLVGVYCLGGIAGGLFYMLAYNLFPYYSQHLQNSFLLGASASVMAVIVSTAVMSPEYKIRLFLIGEVKLEWIAIGSILLSLLQITSSNGGGELAHLGGAAAGYVFTVLYKKGTNVANWISCLIDKVVTLFKRTPTMKVTHGGYTRSETDQQYNARKKEESENIDRILEKIKQSGYDSLSENERKELFGRK